MIRLPDFYLVGAPKAGTSALHRWLAAHPDVFMPENKEPRFFCRFEEPFLGPGVDRFIRTWTKTESEYGALFAPAPVDALVGEGSTDYLHNEGAAERIHARRPDARILILLRNPIDRAYSGHLHLVRDQQEDESFERALELEDERLMANWLPLFGHRRRSLYADAVARYRDVFGEKQVLVIGFEDLTADTRGLGRVCDFLGLDVRLQPMDRVNESGIPRSAWWQRTLRSDTLRKIVMPILGRRRGRQLRERLIGRNLASAPDIDPGLRVRLRDHFASDVDRLNGMGIPVVSAWPEFACTPSDA